jgi:hypothetical protein
MIDYTSRYYNVETAEYTAPQGRTIVYLRRRFLPIPSTETVLAVHTVTQGERLDHIATRYLDDPEQFWRICDANKAMHPEELTAEIGRTLHITLPQPGA